jgi:hypothetical protein
MKKTSKKMKMGGSYGEPGIAEKMKGKKDAKAAFVKLGNVKVASNKSSKKK